MNAKVVKILVIPLVMLFALLPIQLKAQSFYGSIVGTVTDASGAVVAGANVTATNIGTNEKQTAQTDASGNYRFVNLLPANYKVDVEKSGFKRLTRPSVAVQVDAVARIDIALQVGATSETVEVTTQAPLLQTDSASLSQEVEGTQVTEMPLNGRNTMNLLALTPGVVPQYSSQGGIGGNNFGHTASAGWANFQIGGGIAEMGAEYLDGAPLNVIQGAYGEAAGNAPGLVVTQDAVQEFRVESNDVSAEFGRFSGGVVNFTTKSGSNAFHVSAYEFFRNTVLNANDFFNKKNQLQNGEANKPPKFNQNQYGLTVGGPVLKDKLFYFFSYEGFSSRVGNPYQTNVPDSNMDSGIISHYITDPVNCPDPTNSETCASLTFKDAGGNSVTPLADGSNVAQSIINPDYIPQAATEIAKYLPPPNVSGVAVGHNNFYSDPDTGTDFKQYNGRGDYSLNSMNRLFARYTYWKGNDISEDSFNSYNGFKTGGGATKFFTHQAVIGDTITLNSSTVADVRLGFLRFFTGDHAAALGTFKPTDFGWSGNWTSQYTFNMLPQPFWGHQEGLPMLRPMAHQNLDTMDNYSVNASLTKILGRHTLKAGTEVRLMDDSVLGTSQNPTGTYQFDGTHTGNDWSDFLLGYPQSTTIGTGAASTGYGWYQGYYLTDSWQASPKMTVSMGIRWELPGSIAEKHDKATALLPNGTYDGVTGMLALTNSAAYASRYVTAVKHNLFAPRIGFAYRLDDATAIHGGYGISYMPSDISSGILPYYSPINSATSGFTSNDVMPSVFLSDPFKTGANGSLNLPVGRSLGQDFMAHQFGQSLSGAVPGERTPYGEQWNAGIGRQFKGDMMLEADYAGSLSIHVPFGNGGASLDQFPDSKLSQLQEQYYVNGSAAAQAWGYTQLPFAYPGYTNVNNPGADGNGYTNVTDANANWGTANYHALMIKGEKRFHSGGVITGNYTISKEVGTADDLNGGKEHGGGPVGSNNATPQDWNNIAGERSILSFDLPQRAVISYVVDLPFGKGQKWGTDVTGAADKLVSGWSVNGITTLQSGFPAEIQYGGGTHNLLNHDFNSGTLRPNYVPGCDKHKVSGSFFDRLASGASQFNTDCFVYPGDVSYGNEPRVDAGLRSQGTANFDFTLQKMTKITERSNVQFRAEFFNLFNRAQFMPPDYTLNDPPGNASAIIMMMPNGYRIAQFSLRLNY